MSSSDGHRESLSNTNNIDPADPEMAPSRKTSKEPNLPTLPEGQEVNIVPVSYAGAARSTQDTETPSGRSTSRKSAPYATDSNWDIWSRNHPHELTEQEWASDGSKDLQSRTKYPRYFKDAEFTTLLDGHFSNDQPEKDGIMRFQSWIKKLKAEQLVDGEQCDFKRWLSAICVFWKFVVHNTRSASNESSDRKAADDLIALAFQLRTNSGHNLRTQAPLIVPPDCLVADAITTMYLSCDWAQEIEGINNQYLFSWAWQKSAMNLQPNVITFVFEAKHDNLTVVLRQLIMDFYGAQLHRRALRMKDGPVFGAILDNGVLQLYVSSWDADKLIVDTVFHRFPLRDFGRFVECYFALCRIADYQKEWLEKELKRWDEKAEEQSQKLKESSKKPWRDQPKDGPSRGTKRGSEDDGPQGGGKRSATGSGPKAVDEANRLATSIVNGTLSPENIYLPTEVNMLAFDLVTSAKQSEDDYRVSGAAIWAGETQKFLEEYQDPAPCQPRFDKSEVRNSTDYAEKTPILNDDETKSTIIDANIAPESTRVGTTTTLSNMPLTTIPPVNEPQACRRDENCFFLAKVTCGSFKCVTLDVENGSESADTRSDLSTPRSDDDEMSMCYPLEKDAKEVLTVSVEVVESDHGDLNHESGNGAPVIACGGDFFSAHASPNISVC